MQSVTVDPAAPSNIYLGTDLGVFRSVDGGVTWEEFGDGMPPAMILDVRFSLEDHRLRAATFGNGVYQRKIPMPVTGGVQIANTSAPDGFALGQNYPNPFNPSTTIRFLVEKESPVTVTVYDVAGRHIASLVDEDCILFR